MFFQVRASPSVSTSSPKPKRRSPSPPMLDPQLSPTRMITFDDDKGDPKRKKSFIAKGKGLFSKKKGGKKDK